MVRRGMRPSAAGRLRGSTSQPSRFRAPLVTLTPNSGVNVTTTVGNELTRDVDPPDDGRWQRSPRGPTNEETLRCAGLLGGAAEGTQPATFCMASISSSADW